MYAVAFIKGDLRLYGGNYALHSKHDLPVELRKHLSDRLRSLAKLGKLFFPDIAGDHLDGRIKAHNGGVVQGIYTVDKLVYHVCGSFLCYALYAILPPETVSSVFPYTSMPSKGELRPLDLNVEGSIT